MNTPISGATGIGRAIIAIGGQSELARQLGVTQQAINQWYRRGLVPTGRAADVHKLTGVPISELIPRETIIAILDLAQLINAA